MKLEELGRRAVACKHWRWMPGMRCDRGAGWFRIVDGYTIETPSLDTMPDLSDPATVGCLLTLVREAYGDKCIAIGWDDTLEIWSCGVSPKWGHWTNYGAGDTEAEALVRALEAAP